MKSTNYITLKNHKWYIFSLTKLLHIKTKAQKIRVFLWTFIFMNMQREYFSRIRGKLWRNVTSTSVFIWKINITFRKVSLLSLLGCLFLFLSVPTNVVYKRGGWNTKTRIRRAPRANLFCSRLHGAPNLPRVCVYPAAKPRFVDAWCLMRAYAIRQRPRRLRWRAKGRDER